MAFQTKLNLTDDKFCQSDGGILTLCGDNSIAAVGTFKYATDQSSSFVTRSVVDKGYVTGLTNTLSSRVSTIEGLYLTGATNGIGFTGKKVCLGGALVANTAISGAFTMGFNNSILNLTGSSSVNLSSPSVKLTQTPANGANTDLILVREASTGTIKGINGGAVLGAAITGATNGVRKSGQNVLLGGALTGNTAVGSGTCTLGFNTNVLNLTGASSVNIRSASVNLTCVPATGGVTDYILVRDSSTGAIKQVLGTSLGAITGATNGLTKSGQKVKLGGTLTGDTKIGLNGNSLIITGNTNYGIRLYNTYSVIGDEAANNYMCVDNSTFQTSQGLPSTTHTWFNQECDRFNIVSYTASSIGSGINICPTQIYISSNIPTFAGVQYDAVCAPVYRGFYTCNSLVDKGYVTGLTTTSGVQTANNGLTKSGTNVYLGGSLTGDTEISQAGAVCLSVCNTNTTCELLSLACAETYLGTTGDAYLQMQPSRVWFEASPTSYLVLNNGGESYMRQGNSEITMTNASLLVTGGTDGAGMKYFPAQLASNFTKYSLVDKDYVTGVTNTITSNYVCSANNGLIKSGTNVRLGGALTGTTTIDGAQTFNICPTTVNICPSGALTLDGAAICVNQMAKYDADYSGSYTLRSLVDKAYVTGLTTTAGIQTANNGLIKTGTNVRLGGDLTGATTISASQLTVSSNLIATDACYIKFNTNPTIPSTCCGTLYYKDNALNFAREFTGVTLQIGEETVVKVCNVTGGPIANGTAVYVCGANGSLPTIAKSNGSIAAQAEHTIGLTTMNIGSGGQGYVTMMGHVHDVNTGAWAVGTALFVAPSAGGTLTSTMPTYPYEAMMIGTVIVQNSTTGQVLVNPHIMTEYTTIGQFTGYTASTAIALAGKMTCADFDVYTGNTTPIINGLVSMCACAITGATNGLGKPNAHQVCLGGTLSAPTTISGSQLLTLGDLNGICLSTANTNDIALNAKSNGGIYIKSQSGTVASSTDHTTAVGIELDYNGGIPMSVYDNTVGVCKGLQYAADYSTQYSDRSLVDKAYVNSVATGLNVHGAVCVTTTGAITLTGNQTIDGVLTTTGMRVLVKDQSPSWRNGIYSANTGSWGRTPDYDFAPSGEVTNGDLIPVLSGTTYANSQWVLTTPNPIVSGSSNLVFSIFSQQQGVVAGNGICVTTVGANRNVAVKISPSNSGLCFETGALEVDYGIWRYGLTCALTTGKVDVCAGGYGAATGLKIPVRIDTGVTNQLYVDSAAVVTCLGNPIVTACNGLTKVGNYVKLGGSLTGNTTISGNANAYDLCLTGLKDFNLALNGAATITNGLTCGGIKYAADYSANYTARSLVDCAFATSLVTSGVLACNGLTKVGSTVILGGTLTGNTSVLYGASSLCFCDGGTNTIDIRSTCALLHTANNSVCMNACTSAGSLSATVAVANTGVVSLTSTIATGGVAITAPKGAMYTADYTGTFMARSLVDKAYVTGLTTTSGVQTANNGLIKTGTNVRLGGDLTGATTIGGGSLQALSICSSSLLECTSGNIDLRASGTLGLCATGVISLTSAASSGIIITAPTTGALYATDYSAGFIPNSLVTKKYVTGLTTNAICTANNGLIKTGVNVRLGGALTGATTIGDGTQALSVCTASVLECTSGTLDLRATGALGVCSAGIISVLSSVASGIIFTAPTTGAKYAADYSAGFVPRSLVDKAYVTGLTTTSGIQTANNGLIKSGTNVRLGGALTGATTIGAGAQPLSLCNAATLVCATGALDLRGSSTLGVCATGVISVTTAASAGVIVTAPTTGALYAGNYSAGFMARSLVDKAYVTGITSSLGIQTANNGLRKTGLNVVLGAALTGGTTIDGNFALCLGSTATPLAAVNICSASLVECTSGAYSQYSSTGLVCTSSTLDLRATGAAGFCSTGVATVLGADSVVINGNTNGVCIVGGTGQVKLITTPAAGALSDSIIVWNSSDKQLKTVSTSAVGDKNNIYSKTTVTTSTTLTTASPYVILVNSPATPVTIDLPAGPTDGEAFKIKDVGNAAVTNNITINRNGKLIDGGSNDALINTSGGAIELVYDSTLGSWYTLSFVN